MLIRPDILLEIVLDVLPDDVLDEARAARRTRVRVPEESRCWQRGKVYSCTNFMHRASSIHIIESYTAARMHESKLHVAIELKLDKTMLRYKSRLTNIICRVILFFIQG